MLELLTPRLCLRTIERSDAVDISMLLSENSISLGQGSNFYYSPDHILSLIDYEQKHSEQDILSMMIERKSDEALIGIISVNEHTQEAVDIAYFVKPALRRQGYMREALQAYCAYLFHKHNIHCIIAQHRVDNVASAALLKACGFIQSKECERMLLNDYKYHEVITCKLTSDEFIKKSIGGSI